MFLPKLAKARIAQFNFKHMYFLVNKVTRTDDLLLYALILLDANTHSTHFGTTANCVCDKFYNILILGWNFVSTHTRLQQLIL